MISLSRLRLFERSYRAMDLYWLLKTQTIYKQCFGHIGARTRIKRPLRLKNTHNIFIGARVTINPLSWLLTIDHEGKPAHLEIGDGTEIGNFNHITCVRKVSIGRNVLTADRVHISDNSHGYSRVDLPIKEQPIEFTGEVAVGEGTWIGEGVSILGCKVGRNCVVGANAVVVKDVPDYSISVGVPARVIRRFHVDRNQWVPL